MRQVVIGPVTLDFGLNLTGFNPYCRWINKYNPFDKVIVVCRRGEEGMWEFATDFDYIDTNYRTLKWTHKKILPKLSYKTKRKHGVKLRLGGNKIIEPNRSSCTHKWKMFKMFGRKGEHRGYDLLIHARASVKHGTSYKNWEMGNWGQILDYLPDLRVASIGVEAHHVPGTIDEREIPFTELSNMMANSKVLVGPVSGPSYLANLCGLNQVCWAKNTFDKDLNRSVFSSLIGKTNPFKTKLKFLMKNKWNPEPKEVAEEVKKFLTLPMKYQLWES